LKLHIELKIVLASNVSQQTTSKCHHILTVMSNIACDPLKNVSHKFLQLNLFTSKKKQKNKIQFVRGGSSRGAAGLQPSL